jgi:hypothetical protein
MSEVKGYAVRITQNNDLDKICNESYVDLVKKYNGALISPDAQTLAERVNFLGTFAFLKKEEAEGFFRDCANMGIEVLWEKNRPIVDDKYFEGGYK